MEQDWSMAWLWEAKPWEQDPKMHNYENPANEMTGINRDLSIAYEGGNADSGLSHAAELIVFIVCPFKVSETQPMFCYLITWSICWIGGTICSITAHLHLPDTDDIIIGAVWSLWKIPWHSNLSFAIMAIAMSALIEAIIALNYKTTWHSVLLLVFCSVTTVWESYNEQLFIFSHYRSQIFVAMSVWSEWWKSPKHTVY